jgi:hypothetical protein
MIRVSIPDPDPDFSPIPDPGSKGQKCTGSSTLPISDTQFYLFQRKSLYFGRNRDKENLLKIKKLKIAGSFQNIKIF